MLTYSAEIAVTRAASSNVVLRTDAFAATANGLVATLASMDGIENNVWSANTISNGGWNWSLLSGAEYDVVLSNNTVVIAPTNVGVFTVISIGKPGGP